MSENKLTLSERCRIAQECLPDAEYRQRLTALHDEMLATLFAKEPSDQQIIDLASDAIGGKPGIAMVGDMPVERAALLEFARELLKVESRAACEVECNAAPEGAPQPTDTQMLDAVIAGRWALSWLGPDSNRRCYVVRIQPETAYLVSAPGATYGDPRDAIRAAMSLQPTAPEGENHG